MKPSGPSQIIGLTGPFGSGKSTAANFFESKGYKIITLSSFLEDEVKKRGIEITRKNLQDIGNEFRQKYGAGFLMEKALKSLKNEKKIVIDGIRNLGEVDVLKKKKGLLLAVIADRNIRFERLQKLKRREKLTKKLFEQLDLRDLGINEKISGLQTAFCITLADVFIDSNSDMKTFCRKLEKFYGGHLKELHNSYGK